MIKRSKNITEWDRNAMTALVQAHGPEAVLGLLEDTLQREVGSGSSRGDEYDAECERIYFMLTDLV